jgi:hypothetical protein
MHIQLSKEHTSVPMLFSVLLVDEAADSASVHLRTSRNRSGARHVFLGGCAILDQYPFSLGRLQVACFPEIAKGVAEVLVNWDWFKFITRYGLGFGRCYAIGVQPVPCFARSSFGKVELVVIYPQNSLEMIVEGSW